jgi:integrase
MTESRPYLSSFKDRHGTERWRFRRNGKTISLLGSPGEPDFENAYESALNGLKKPAAKIVKHPNAALPCTLGAAWRLVIASAEWKAFDPATKDKNSSLASMFLESRVIETDPFQWRDVPVRDLKRRHLKDIISKYSETPHKAKHLLTAIRKMIDAAMDEEWIDVDPSYKLKWRPEYVGWKAWTAEAMRKYEERWPIGSTPRLAYALALWLGNRREDVAGLKWEQRVTKTVLMDGQQRKVDGFNVVQGKGGKELFLPIMPMLSDILDATERRGPTVLVTAYGEPFSPKSITGRMADWTNSAGIEPGFTLHGLRKTLGKMLAEGGASTRQIMDTLGHDDIAHAELYSREAEQSRLATDGMDRVIRLVGR